MVLINGKREEEWHNGVVDGAQSLEAFIILLFFFPFSLILNFLSVNL
jgi:hypothetical protein